MTLVKYLKQVNFYKKLYNYYLVKNNTLYFQDKLSFNEFLNQCFGH